MAKLLVLHIFNLTASSNLVKLFKKLTLGYFSVKYANICFVSDMVIDRTPKQIQHKKRIKRFFFFVPLKVYQSTRKHI